jgi:hypothetical protein
VYLDPDSIASIVGINGNHFLGYWNFQIVDTSHVFHLIALELMYPRDIILLWHRSWLPLESAIIVPWVPNPK